MKNNVERKTMQYKKMREEINKIAEKIADKRVMEMFLKCFYNTLETTTEYLPDGTTYVFTGDIPAMWLRDSSVQVTGYLPYVNCDPDVKAMIKGLLKRQFKFVQIDTYSNAFNDVPHERRHRDATDFSHGNIWERKYEIDSLCYPLWLLVKYYELSKDGSVFDEDFDKAFKLITDTFITEQKHDEKSPYYFKRSGDFSSDTLDNDGKGAKSGYTGMTWSAFRPSDDKCVYHYLVPSNQMVVATFKKLIPILSMLNKDKRTIQKSEKLMSEIEEGIKKFAVVVHEKFGKIYAYEIDGLGNYNLMDDANVPSLLSLPYLGYCDINDELYQNTRKFILSESNPFYFFGKYGKGIGSPHTPKNHIWHISLVIQLLTSGSEKEINECFNTLTSTDAGTGFMHESFDADNPEKFTREWFAWANTLFAVATVKMLSKGA